MSTPISADNFLMGGGGAPSAKFPAVGTTVTGRITEKPTVEQQRDFNSGDPKFWNDGNPMMQLVVTIQTADRDPAIDEDDGRRRVFVKGQLKQAVQGAVKQAGARGLEVGGQLKVTYTHDGEKKGNLNPPKQYRVEYTAAAQAELAGAGGQGVPPGVNPVTGEVAEPSQQPAPTNGQQPIDPNDPAVKALLAQLGGQQVAPAQTGGNPPF